MSFELKNVTILEMVDGLLRSWWTVVAGLCLGLAAGIVAVRYTPPLYEARATVYAEATKVPDSVAGGPVVEDKGLRLKQLFEEVLSDARLSQLVSEVFSEADETERARLVSSVRSRVQITYARNIRFFDIKYRDSDPQRAAAVTNGLADLYREENARLQANRAGEVAETVEELAAETLKDLQRAEKEYAEFQARHPRESAAQLPVNMEELAKKRLDLEANRETQRQSRERLQEFEDAKAQSQLLDQFRPGVTAGPEVAADPGLARLEAELKSLRLRYADGHPTIQAKLREIEDYEASRNRQETAASPAPSSIPSQPSLPPWDAGIRAERLELTKLQAEERRLLAQMGDIQRRIDAAPQTQQRLVELDEKVLTLREKYTRHQRELEAARSRRRVEQSEKGNDFEIIERAVPPSTPVWPKPLPMYGLGMVAGLTLFVGPLLAKRLLVPLVGSEAGMEALSDVPVLVSIPRIPTPGVAAMLRRRRGRNIGLTLASVAVLATVVAVFRW